MEDHVKALSRAKISLLRRSIFLASVSFELHHLWNEDISTARTDGLTIEYSPQFFMSLSSEEQIGLVAHEIWHVALNHMGRIGNRDPDVWNDAGDYVINLLLAMNGFTIPSMGLLDYQFADMSTEEVYEHLLKHPEKQSQNPAIKDIRMPGSLTKGDDGKPTPASVAQGKTAKVLVKANTVTKMSGKQQGTLPAEFIRIVDELINPRISWVEYLHRFMNNIVKDDYSYRRPNKRFVPDYYLPSQGIPSIGKLDIAIDTSGSITPEDLRYILSEIEGIRNTFNPQELTIFDCDARIHHEYQVEQHDNILDFKFTGGGGTSFMPVLKRCAKDPPVVLLYFTDLYAEHIKNDPGYPTIWVCYSDHKPQGIGETVYYQSPD